MDNIFADRYRGLVARSARAPEDEEQVQKQHDRVLYRSVRDDYNPWPDINPNEPRQHPTQADAVGFDIFINMDNKLSCDDLKNEENIVKQPEKEYCNYQWSEPHAQQKTAKHESAGSTCSDNALQLSWESRAMELRLNQEKHVFTSDKVHKVKRLVDSIERKRKVNDYPKWSFEDPKDEAVGQEKKHRKLNKRGARDQKRKTKRKAHVGDSCSQCKCTDQLSMVDDEVFTYTCQWMPS